MLWHLYLAGIFLYLQLIAGAPHSTSNYSTWMASSIMSRSQGIMTGKEVSSELLEAGFTQKAFSALVAQYPDAHCAEQIREYITKSAASVVPFTLDASHNALSYPLDRLSNGDALLNLSRTSSDQSQDFAAAAAALRLSINKNRRTSEGGLWYSTLPRLSYLNGMYSLAPFYTFWTTETDQNNATATAHALDDMQLQFDLLWNHTHNASTGLLVHGYDASRTAVWADPVTGASPHVWGRSLGWFFMALVDTLELLSSCEEDRREGLLVMFRVLTFALLNASDPKSGAWWQVLDQSGRDGNYVESSGSAMFVYASLKGLRLGYLDDDALALTVLGKASRAYAYLTDRFVVQAADGLLDYDGTVSVCSLNSSASYEYYVEQPIEYNSVLGSAAYVLASLEIERL